MAAPGVFGPDGGGQAERDIVGAGDCFFFGLKGLDGDDGSEDFLAGAFGAVGHADQYGRRDKVARTLKGCAAGGRADAGAPGTLEVADDAVEVSLGRQGSDLDLRPGTGFAHLERADLLNQQLREPVGSGFVDQHPAGRSAFLT